MGGLTPFSHSQYETIARSSIDDPWRLNRSRQRRSITEQQQGIVVGSPELPSEKSWKNANTSLKPVTKEGISLARRSSTSDVPCSADNKQNRRFVSNKVLLELRSNYKTGNRTQSTSVGGSSTVDESIKSKLNNKSSSSHCRAFSVGAESVFLSNGVRRVLKSQDVANERSADTNTKPCFLLDKQMHNYVDSPNLTQTKPAQQPTKTVLQLHQNRPSRTNSIDISSKVDLKENQLGSERPAYARRFMLNRSETVVPLLSRPSYDEGLTPLFNEKLKEPHHFVLPPLPLGLRPPSPEPRSLLLNAPKKRRFSSSNAFDLSCLGRMLKPYQSKSHSQKRPVCRVLRFGD